VTCAACLLGAGVRGEQTLSSPQAPRFRSSVTNVEVDVSVIDQARQPVRGLKEYDFAVFEDGEKQPIATFAEIEVPPASPAPPGWMRTVAPDVASNIAQASRLIVLMLDDAIDSADARLAGNVRRIGRQVVDRLGAGDVAAVLFTRNDARGQDFTSDRSRLLTSIDTFDTRGSDFMTGYFSRATVGRLLSVTNSLGAVPQRQKVLIYVSPGIPDSFGPPVFGRGVRGQDALDVRARLMETMADARRANVSVYSIDPRGLDPEAAGHPNDFLMALSEGTGGFAVVNRNSFEDGVAQIFRENASYYLIGYRPTNLSPNPSFRHIDVRVYRPGLIVRAREGYTKPAVNPVTDSTSPSPQLATALRGLVPKSDLGMQVTAAPFARAGKKEAALVVVAAIRQPAPVGEGRLVEDADVLVVAFDAMGTWRGGQRMKGHLLLRPVAATQLQYEVMTRFYLKPGRYQLRFAAESAIEGKSGSVFYDVDIPDFSGPAVSLSGVVLNTVPTVASGGQEQIKSIIPIVPTARREFWSTDRATAFLRVYQGGKNPLVPVSIRARIADPSDHAMFDRSDTLAAAVFSAARGTDYRVEIPIAQLPPGLYLLTIEARLGEKAVARREVRFVRR
jgi:VWFA-related protein